MQKYRIIIRARELFFQEGFKTVTMDLLAKKLSMSKKTIYKFYKTKDELLLAAIELITKQMTKRINKIINDKRKSFPEKLTNIFLMIAKRLSKFNPLFLAELKEKRPDIFFRIQKFRQESIMTSMTKLIDDGKAEGYIRENIETEVFTQSYLVLIEHFISPEFLLRSKLKADDIYRQIIKIVFIGMIKSDFDTEFKNILKAD